MGTINLSKNQTVNLSKESAGLQKVVVGLGWDPAKLGILGGGSIDCDAFCVALSGNRRVQTVYFGNMSACNHCIEHTGDNLTGDGDGDDEQIIFDLKNMPSNIDRLVIGVNIYNGRERNQDFSKIKNAFIRIFDVVNKKELCIYKLSGSEFKNYVTVTFGELYRSDSREWQFKAIGEGSNASSIGDYSSYF